MIIELTVFGLVVFNVGLAVWLVYVTKAVNNLDERDESLVVKSKFHWMEGKLAFLTARVTILEDANKDQVIVNENFAKDIAELKTSKKKRK